MLLAEAADARCVAGCYRCLLSYYNQPDHELIDRTERDVKTVLLRLRAVSVAATVPQERSRNQTAIGMLRWRAGALPAPDGDPLTVEGTILPLAWRAHLAAAAIGSVDAETRAGGRGAGLYGRAFFPRAPGDAPPAELVELLGTTA